MNKQAIPWDIPVVFSFSLPLYQNIRFFDNLDEEESMKN